MTDAERRMRHVLVDIDVHPDLPGVPTTLSAETAAFVTNERLYRNAQATARNLERAALNLGEDFGEHLDGLHELLTAFAEASESCDICWWKVSP